MGDTHREAPAPHRSSSAVSLTNSRLNAPVDGGSRGTRAGRVAARVGGVALFGVRVVVLSVLYVPFVWAVLLKSVREKKAHNPADALPARFLVGCIVLFLALCALPFLFAFLLFPGLSSHDADARLRATNAAAGVCLVVVTAWQWLACVYMWLRCGGKLPKMRYARMARWGRNGAINAFKVGSLVLDFLQLLVIALHAPNQRTWPGWMEDGLDELSAINTGTPTWAGNRLLLTFNLGVVLIGAYCLLIGLFIVFDIRVENFGAPVLYEFWSGTLFIPIVSRLVQLLFCRETDGELLWEDVQGNPSQECYVGRHQVAAPAAMLMLLFYMSSATFMATYQAPTTPETFATIQFSPAFQTLERTIKTLLVVGLSASRDEPRLRAAIVAVVALLLLLVGYRMWPCSSKVLNRVQIAVFLAVIWASLLKLEVPELAPDTALALLAAVWASVLVGAIVFSRGARPVVATSRKAAHSVKRLRFGGAWSQAAAGVDRADEEVLV